MRMKEGMRKRMGMDATREREGEIKSAVATLLRRCLGAHNDTDAEIENGNEHEKGNGNGN